MGINADSKSSAHGAVPINGNYIQPTTSNQSKAADVGQVHQNRNGNIMATIRDDDDRLLVRIGYTPVSNETFTCKETTPNSHHRFYADISLDGLPSPTPYRFLVY
jgi:hypothetical protein